MIDHSKMRKILNVRASRACNLKCPYCCSKHFLDGKNPSIPIDILMEAIDEFSIEYVSFNGLGETTLCPNIVEAIIEASKRVKHIDIFTNVSARPLAWWESLIWETKAVELSIQASLHLLSGNYADNLKLHAKVDEIDRQGRYVHMRCAAVINNSVMDAYENYRTRDRDRFPRFWEHLYHVWDMNTSPSERVAILMRLGKDHPLPLFSEEIETDRYLLKDTIEQAVQDGYDPGYLNCLWDADAYSLQSRRDGDWGVYITDQDCSTTELYRRGGHV